MLFFWEYFASGSEPIAWWKDSARVSVDLCALTLDLDFVECETPYTVHLTSVHQTLHLLIFFSWIAPFRLLTFLKIVSFFRDRLSFIWCWHYFLYWLHQLLHTEYWCWWCRKYWPCRILRYPWRLFASHYYRWDKWLWAMPCCSRCMYWGKWHWWKNEV
jgi:hypothetical protein